MKSVSAGTRPAWCGRARQGPARQSAAAPPEHYREDPSKPPGERRFACKWQPTEHFSAHFYPTACPLHDMIAFMHNATHLVHWPHTERVWRTGPDGHARKPGSTSRSERT